MHLAAAVLAGAMLAAPTELQWKWQRFTATEGAVTGTALLATGAIIVFTSEKPPAWTRRLVLEDPLRDAVRGDIVSHATRGDHR